MEKELVDASGDTQNLGETSEKKDHVSYESFQKILKEKKKAVLEAQELREYKARLEQEKLELEGKKDEALALWKKKAESYENEVKAIKQRYHWNSLESQIKNVAQEHGCTNTDALLKLLDKDSLKSLEVDDNFNVDREGLSKVIEDSKKKFADLNLFGKRKVEVHDVQGIRREKAPSLDELVAKCKTPQEVAQLLKSLN